MVYSHSGRERSEKIKAGKNDDGQEESIVVENGESGRLIVSHFVFLPQNPTHKPLIETTDHLKQELKTYEKILNVIPLIFFLFAHLLVISQSFVHF